MSFINVEAANSYDLRYCLDWDSLVQDFSNCAPVEVVPALPGSRESVFLPIEDPNTTLFFGLKSTYKDTYVCNNNSYEEVFIYKVTLFVRM